MGFITEMELLPALCGLLPSPGLDSPTLIAHSQAWQLASSLIRQSSHIASVPQLGEWGISQYQSRKGSSLLSSFPKCSTVTLGACQTELEVGLGWGTDGSIKPRPCAMTRRIKIIPDLAPRAWPLPYPVLPTTPPKRLPESPPKANSRPKQHPAPS